MGDVQGIALKKIQQLRNCISIATVEISYQQEKDCGQVSAALWTALVSSLFFSNCCIPKKRR